MEIEIENVLMEQGYGEEDGKIRYAGQVEWRVNAFKNAVVSSTASSPFCWEDVEKFVGGDLKTAVGRAMEKSKRKGKKTSGGGKAPEKEEGGSGENSQDGGDGGMGVLNMFNKGGKGGGKGWNLDVYVRVMKGIENGSRWEVKEGINDGVWNEDVGKRCEGERRKGRNFKLAEVYDVVKSSKCESEEGEIETGDGFRVLEERKGVDGGRGKVWIMKLGEIGMAEKGKEKKNKKKGGEEEEGKEERKSE